MSGSGMKFVEAASSHDRLKHGETAKDCDVVWWTDAHCRRGRSGLGSLGGCTVGSGRSRAALRRPIGRGLFALSKRAPNPRPHHPRTSSLLSLLVHYILLLPSVLMQALRLARPRLPLRSGSRTLAAAATSAHGAAPTASSSAAPVVPLSNVEAMWERLSANEQLAIHQQLEELQKKDWKSLTIDEKKAGASVSHRYLRVRPRGKEAFSLTCLRVRAHSVLCCVRPPRPPCTRQPPRDDR